MNLPTPGRSRVRRTAPWIGLIAACCLLTGLHAGPDRPPVEAFGMRPQIDHVLLSPSGSHYAGLQWARGRPYLAIYDLADDSDERVKLLEIDVGESIVERVRKIHWLNDRSVGVVVEFEASRGGVPTVETRLFVIRRDLSKGHWIPARKRLKWEAGRSAPTGQFQHRILDYLREDPDHILMALDLDGRGAALSAVRVQIETGTTATVEPGRESVSGFDVDQQGRVRLRYEVRAGEREIFVRDLGSEKWRPLRPDVHTGPFEFTPLAFTEDGLGLLVFNQTAEGVDEIIEFDLATGKLGERLPGLPTFGIEGLVRDPYDRKVLGVAHAEHHPAVHYLDQQLAEIQRQIDAALPESSNSIESFDRERKRYIVLASGPRVPGTYYLMSGESLELFKIGDRYASRLAPEQLRDVEPIRYEARDGLSIPGYLTRPEGAGPFPMVLLPHGGPTARDYRGFDPVAQFLVSRGMAVLQPNFRGSSGYGASFQQAGYGEWGLAMQDDLTDGVKAMIERGIADPDRICIVGWSYGGYAALMGAVRTPELYRCAVSGAGVTDIRRMLSEDARYKFGLKNQPSVGHYRDDRDKLEESSPIHNVAAIQVPILLVHGDSDRNVPVGHSKKMAASLRKAKKPHKLVVLKDGNHFLALERNRVQYLRELESFLAEHLAPRKADPPG